ncbi:TatD family hydrolase [Methanococcoides sp. SA1]|nr:TatD family hydrolase [Methanococcoides sp. SA1]
MKLVDVHCHLESMRFDGDRDEVVARFVEKGGEAMICSGTGPENNRKVLALARRFDCVKASFGLYPVGNFSKDVEAELAWIEEYKGECVAIGECGLDFDNEKRKKDFERQKGLFEKQIDLAMKLGLPIVVHSRKAEAEAIEILEAKGADKVVMHCFCGKKSLIKRCTENGWFFSVPPAIKRWKNFEMLVEVVPLELLLTETDAPYLGAVARERNESGNVVVTLEEIGRIKGLGVDEVGETIFENSKKLFEF